MAASVGPYGAMLADGSEYSGDYGVTDDVLRGFHRRRMEVLVDAGPDLLAIETVPSLQEAAVLLDVLGEMPAGTRAWLSLSCADDSHTRRGDDVSAAFALAAGSDRVVAVGVNCTAPEHVTALVGPGGRSQRQAGRRVPEQRRGLGRADEVVDRPGICDRRGACPGVGRCRRDVRRWLLPGRLGRHRPARRGHPHLTSRRGVTHGTAPCDARNSPDR